VKQQAFAVCLVALVACSTPTYAGDKGHDSSSNNGTGNSGNGNGNQTLTLIDGDTFGSPGKMFQYLRTRTDAVAGNPQAIVNAYPDSFDNVGDLIRQKREATAP